MHLRILSSTFLTRKCPLPFDLLFLLHLLMIFNKLLHVTLHVVLLQRGHLPRRAGYSACILVLQRLYRILRTALHVEGLIGASSLP